MFGPKNWVVGKKNQPFPKNISKFPCICNVFTFLGNFADTLVTDAIPSEISAGLQTLCSALKVK